jgi:hypothetical protein
LSKNVIIKSFNGIGDLLFVTPSFRVIKKAYPNCKIIVNTNRPSLLEHNPFVDEVGRKDEGVFLGYPAPAEGIAPVEHHIISDWKIICYAYGLETEKPDLQPELYIKDLSSSRNGIGVQVLHKGYWHNKKVWPYFQELSQRDGMEAIPDITSGDKMKELVKKIASYSVVVCAEGGISHIAQALGIPAVVLYGGFADPEWNGYSNQVNITKVVDCSYCYNQSPCKGDYKCWKQIYVPYVEELAKQLLVNKNA